MKYWSAEYEKEIEVLQKIFRQLGALMSVKLHLLRTYLNYFPKNRGDLSDDQGERFHLGICITEERY